MLQVAWKNLYSKSSSDYGTLAFFRSRLNRVAVSNEPKKSVDATIDFLETVTKGHWLGCACDILGISSLDDTISVPPYIVQGTARQKLAYIRGIAQMVVDRVTLVDSAFLTGDTDTDDKVYNYARVLCHYGALMIEFRDGWAEVDGERVVRCWRLFMPHFRASGCTKYALEVLRLQIQLKVLSPNLSHQIKWHRFVNTRGGLGMNIPCNLYNEHVNKLVKLIIQNMGSNLTEKSLQRAVRCVSPLYAICKRFDAETNVPTITSAHSTKSDLQDIGKVVSLVLQRSLVMQMGSRNHQSFPSLKLDPLAKWDRKKTETWIKEKINEYGKHKGKFREREVTVHEEEEELSSDEGM